MERRTWRFLKSGRFHKNMTAIRHCILLNKSFTSLIVYILQFHRTLKTLQIPASPWWTKEVLHVFWLFRLLILLSMFHTDCDPHWGLTGTERKRNRERNRKKIQILLQLRGQNLLHSSSYLSTRDISVHSGRWRVTNYSSNIRISTDGHFSLGKSEIKCKIRLYLQIPGIIWLISSKKVI